MITDKERIDFIQTLMDKNDMFEIRVSTHYHKNSQPSLNEQKLQMFTILTQHRFGNNVRELIDEAINNPPAKQPE